MDNRLNAEIADHMTIRLEIRNRKNRSFGVGITAQRWGELIWRRPQKKKPMLAATKNMIRSVIQLSHVSGWAVSRATAGGPNRLVHVGHNSEDHIGIELC